MTTTPKLQYHGPGNDIDTLAEVARAASKARSAVQRAEMSYLSPSQLAENRSQAIGFALAAQVKLNAFIERMTFEEVPVPGRGYEHDPYTCMDCGGIRNIDGAYMVPDDGELCTCGTHEYEAERGNIDDRGPCAVCGNARRSPYHTEEV